jgi:hypothetical protein
LDPVISQLLVATGLNLVVVPIAVFVMKRFIGKRLDDFDGKREEARMERAESNRKAIEQREAESAIILAMSRTMLLNNYERCMEKGYYTVEERDVYGTLFRNYISDGGNGVIAEIAPRIRALPMEPPEEGDRHRQEP